MSTVTYEVHMSDGSERCYRVDIERSSGWDRTREGTPPDWTRLDQEQCSNCPLDPQQHPYCPAALEFEEIAMHFANAASIERVDVWVHTDTRSYFKNTDMQTMLKSLYGLIMATGGCPILARLKPLARFHLPFATFEETVHRVLGHYLIDQYLTRDQSASGPDWKLEGIRTLYLELNCVNMALIKRIRQASKRDASVNAIQTFISISSLVGMGIDEVIDLILPSLRTNG